MTTTSTTYAEALTAARNLPTVGARRDAVKAARAAEAKRLDCKTWELPAEAAYATTCWI